MKRLTQTTFLLISSGMMNRRDFIWESEGFLKDLHTKVHNFNLQSQIFYIPPEQEAELFQELKEELENLMAKVSRRAKTSYKRVLEIVPGKPEDFEWHDD